MCLRFRCFSWVLLFTFLFIMFFPDVTVMFSLSIRSLLFFACGGKRKPFVPLLRSPFIGRHSLLSALQPEYMRREAASSKSSSRWKIKITVISGQTIPKTGQGDGEVVDPYVVIKIYGHPNDKQKQKTSVVRANGKNAKMTLSLISCEGVERVAQRC